jgi:cell volume regulation protein A
MSLAFVLLTLGIADLLNGSGFLAVYLMGLVMNHVDIVHKRSLQRFHDGFAWLMQITMFLILGLFIFPSRLIPVSGIALLIALILIFIARPLGVYITLILRPLKLKEKAFISWVGLRGAAPIILATFPMLAGIDQSDLFFNVIFFIVLTSVLIQGTTLPLVARWLNLDEPVQKTPVYPIEYHPVAGMDSKLLRMMIPPDSVVVNKPIVELNLPDKFLITLIERGHQFIVPYGGTVLRAIDTLLVLTDEASLISVVDRFGWQQLDNE